MELYGNKVKLRAIEYDDLEFLREMINDPWIESMVYGWSFPVSKKQQIDWYESLSKNSYSMHLIIETKEEGPVGVAGLRDIDWKNRCADGGIKLQNRKNMSKGIATDTYMTLLRYGFYELQLNRVNGSVLEYNQASLNFTINKIGYKQEGIRRKAIFKNGEYHDLILIGILKEDYEEKIKETKYWEIKEESLHN